MFGDIFNKGKIEGLTSEIGTLQKTNASTQAELDRLMELVIKPDFRLYGGMSGVQPLILPVRLQDLVNMSKINSVLRTVTINLKSEIFRRKPIWEPRFVKKCVSCGKEHKEEIEKCDCGCTTLIPPDTKQREKFEKFLRVANKNKQTAVQVFKQIEEDLDVIDDGYIILIKDYIIDSNEIVYQKIKEIISGDPIMLRVVANEKGEIGGKYWVCLLHREGRQNTSSSKHDRELGRVYKNPGVCEICGRKLHEVHHVAIQGGDQGVTPAQYYVEGEVIHTSKYSPSLIYGYPPVLSVWKEASTLLNMAHYVNEYYKQMRTPKGVLFVNTMNPESLYKKWDEISERIKTDPHYIPMLATQGESNSKNRVDFVKFIDSLTEMQYGPSKDELRQRISAIYGVSNILMNDAGTSGGMNNEGLQIKVTDRAIQSGQQIWNEIIFPSLLDQFDITHWDLKLLPNEEADEMKTVQLKTAEAQHAQIMLQMGFDVKLDADGKFEYSGEAQDPTEMMGAPPAPEGAEEGEIEPGEDLEEDRMGEELEDTGGKYSKLLFGDGGEEDIAKSDGSFLGSGTSGLPGEMKKLMPWKRGLAHNYRLKEVIRRDGHRQKVWCKAVEDEAVRSKPGKVKVKPELKRTKLNFWARPQQTWKRQGYTSKWEDREHVNIEKPISPLKQRGIEQFVKTFRDNIHVVVFKDRKEAKDQIGGHDMAFNEKEKKLYIAGNLTDKRLLKMLDEMDSKITKLFGKPEKEEKPT